MVYRLSGSPITLVLITIAILIGTAGIMTEQVKFLALNHDMNFIPEEVELEGSIAILIASFGVFLEHRRYLLDRIYSNDLPDAVEKFDLYSHNVGVMFILVAILMESADLFFLALNSWQIGFSELKFIEIALLFAINLVSFIMFLIFGYKSIKEAE